MTRILSVAVAIVTSVACVGARDLSTHDVEVFLATKYPYEWTISPSLRFPWVYKDMPRGIVFEPGEFPVKEVVPAQVISDQFPGIRFFESKVRTNEWHLNEVPWPILVGVLGDPRREPAVFHSLGKYGQGQFFELFTEGSFASQTERVTFAEGLAKLVFLVLRVFLQVVAH